MKAKVVDTTGALVTTQTINVTFDPDHHLIVPATYATTSAQRLALDLNLAASNVVNLATSPPTVVIKPFMRVATSAADTKQVRVRGPLINSSANVGTYTVYIRPFYDAVNSLGSLTLFNDANTIYTINGTTYVGAPGIKAISQLSAGSTMTAAYTNYQPTATPSATAGIFTPTLVIAGSTLEDFYTQGLEGDVVRRTANTLTLRGSTLQFNNGTSTYNEADALVLLGPSTEVTADGNTTLTGLDQNSISVGQHIIARGLYSLPASNIITLDATGSSSTNTGSVRMQPTELWGLLVSSASASLVLDLQTIENWPTASFNFSDNGAGVTPANYTVDTSGLTLPAGYVGAPLWIDGFTTAFGSAPPDFKAVAIHAESTVPASLQVDWTAAGTTAPFATLTGTEMSIDLANTALTRAVIRIGSESIDMKSLTASTSIVPKTATPPAAGLPAVFLPAFAIGNLSAANTTSISVYNTFATFTTQLPKVIVAATPALHFVAGGVYNRATNVFTASSIDVVN